MEFKMPEISEAGPILIVVMRVMLGWIMLWAFFDKMFGLGFETPAGEGYIDGGSPSSFVTWMTDGVFADFYTNIAGNGLVDILMLAGCLGLGLSFMLGFASKPSVLFMTVFLVMMYMIEVPPADNPVVDYHIIYIVAVFIVYFFNGFEKWSVNHLWKELFFVKRFPLLE